MEGRPVDGLEGADHQRAFRHEGKRRTGIGWCFILVGDGDGEVCAVEKVPVARDDDDVVGPCAQGQALGFVGHELRDLAQSLFVAPLIAAFDREKKR